MPPYSPRKRETPVRKHHHLRPVSVAENDIGRASRLLSSPPLHKSCPEGQVLGATELYQQYAQFVASFVTHLGVCPTHLADAVQQVFVLAHQAGGYTHGDSTPRSWLGALAIRAAAHVRGDCACATGTPAPNKPGWAQSGAQPVGPETGALHRVHGALSSLNDRQRAIFVLFELENEETPAIAAAMGLALPDLRAQLQQARTVFLEAAKARYMDGA